MFLVYVIVGETIQLPTQSMKVPPLKRDHMGARHQEFITSDELLQRNVNQEQIRFDSVTNVDGSHIIVYDSNKQYPGYLISYV